MMTEKCLYITYKKNNKENIPKIISINSTLKEAEKELFIAMDNFCISRIGTKNHVFNQYKNDNSNNIIKKTTNHIKYIIEKKKFLKNKNEETQEWEIYQNNIGYLTTDKIILKTFGITLYQKKNISKFFYNENNSFLPENFSHQVDYDNLLEFFNTKDPIFFGPSFLLEEEKENNVIQNVDDEQQEFIIELKNKIEEQGNKVRKLKEAKTEKSIIQPEIDSLLKLKEELSKAEYVCTINDNSIEVPRDIIGHLGAELFGPLENYFKTQTHQEVIKENCKLLKNPLHDAVFTHYKNENAEDYFYNYKNLMDDLRVKLLEKRKIIKDDEEEEDKKEK